MSKSRKNPGREKNLQDFKNRKKTEQKIKKQINTIMEERQGSQNGMPEIRQSPVWNSDEIIEVSGHEWEAIFNFIESSSSAFMAANSVMSRNIINNKIRLKFEKLNKETLMYEDMTPEEEAPYQAEFQKAVKSAIEASKASKENSLIVTPDQIEAEDMIDMELPSQEGLPRLDGLVDKDGNPV